MNGGNTMFEEYLWAFVIGGALCLIAQIIMDLTKLVSGEILVIYVVAGVVLSALGIYEYLVDLGGCGATVPLTGFGYTLVKGTMTAVDERGLIGVFTGGLTAAAGGIGSAVVFGYIFSLIGRAKTKC